MTRTRRTSSVSCLAAPEHRAEARIATRITKSRRSGARWSNVSPWLAAWLVLSLPICTPSNVAAQPTSDAGALAAGTLAPDPAQTGSPATTNLPASPPPVRTNTCVEHIPEGKQRPQLSESFPTRGLSGHRATLQLTIEHGQGERVLPGALEIQSESDAAKAVARAGFMLPDFAGPAKPSITRRDGSGGLVQSRVTIHVVPLPKEGGRHELTLPPLPVAMARASGDIVTICTQPHAITVEDPIANKPNPKPKPNPPPRRQTELWETLRTLVYGAGAGLVLAAVLALLLRWWTRRPKKLPPPPPPRPPWEVAMEALHDIRQARLIEQGRLQDHVDRTSDALRLYLGNRFEFEGLESTSFEVLKEIQQRPEAASVLTPVAAFLQETDLVKFANVEPTEAQCQGVLERAEEIVRASTPPKTAPETPPKTTSGPSRTGPAEGQSSASAENNQGGQP